jgi:hypothetical protein
MELLPQDLRHHKMEPLLPNSASSSSQLAVVLTQAKVLVKDAIHHRSLEHGMDKKSLRAGKIMRHPLWQLLMAVAIFGNCLLAIPERPSTFLNFVGQKWDTSILAACEMICILIFACDATLRWRYFGKAIRRNR